MQSSKVYHFLLLLDSKERKRFHDFLQSPFFNRKPEIISLYQIFREKILPPKGENLSEEATYQLLVPRKEFNKNRLRKWKSELQDHLLNFLKISNFQKSEMAPHLSLLEDLNDRQEINFFPQYWQEALKSLEQNTQPDSNHFRKAMGLELEKLRYQVRKGKRIFREGPAEMVTRSMEFLDKAYQEEKLLLIYIIGQNRGFYLGEHQLDEWTPFLERMGAIPEQLSPKGRILLRLCQAFSAPADKVVFRTILNELAELKPQIKLDDLFDLYTGTLNLCIERINKGGDGWEVELFHLYNQMLKEELLLLNGKIQVNHFKNIVSTAARVGEYEWLRHFMDEFSKRLIADPKKNAITYNMGVIRFFEGDQARKTGDQAVSRAKFEEAESLFNKVLPDFEDIFYGLDARIYLLRIYYETGNAVGMDSLCSATRMYVIRNNAISRKRKANYQLFLKFYRRLMNTPPKDEKRLRKLLDEVIDAGNVGGPWMREKLEELLGE